MADYEKVPLEDWQEMHTKAAFGEVLPEYEQAIAVQTKEFDTAQPVSVGDVVGRSLKFSKRHFCLWFKLMVPGTLLLTLLLTGIFLLSAYTMCQTGAITVQFDELENVVAQDYPPVAPTVSYARSIMGYSRRGEEAPGPHHGQGHTGQRPHHNGQRPHHNGQHPQPPHHRPQPDTPDQAAPPADTPADLPPVPKPEAVDPYSADGDYEPPYYVEDEDVPAPYPPLDFNRYSEVVTIDLVPFLIILGVTLVIAGLVSWLVSPIMFAPMTYAINHVYTREEVLSMSKAFALSRPRWCAFLGSIFLAGLITFGGFILLIIPGLVFSVYLTVAQAAVVIDPTLSGKKSIRTSFRLVKGNFWRTVGMWLLAFLVTSAMDMCVSLLLHIHIVPFFIYYILSMFVGIFKFAFYQALPVIYYHDLVARKTLKEAGKNDIAL